MFVSSFLLDLRGEVFPVLAAWDYFKRVESVALGRESCPPFVTVVAWPSRFLWDESGESGERGVWRRVRCERDVVVKFVCLAPWRAEALNELRAVWDS